MRRWITRLFLLAVLVIAAGGAAQAIASEQHGSNSAFCDAFVRSLIPTRDAPFGENTVIEVGFWPLEVGHIDDKSQSFFADFYMALLWRDPRLVYEDKQFTDADGTDLGEPPAECDLAPRWLTEADHVWNPALEFIGLRGEPTVRAERLLVESDGYVFHEARYVGTFAAAFDFRKFPFDRQSIGLAVQPFDQRETVVMKPYAEYFEGLDDETLMAGASELRLLDWELVAVTVDEEIIDYGDEQYSRIAYVLDLERKALSFTLNFFVPVGMLVVLAGAVFWLMPRETETRVNLSVTSLLTLVAFNLVLRDELPTLPYLTLADQVNLLSLVFAISAVFVVVGIHVLKSRGRDATIQRIEPWLRFGFPAIYVVVIVWLLVREGASSPI